MWTLHFLGLSKPMHCCVIWGACSNHDPQHDVTYDFFKFSRSCGQAGSLGNMVPESRDGHKP